MFVWQTYLWCASNYEKQENHQNQKESELFYSGNRQGLQEQGAGRDRSRNVARKDLRWLKNSDSAASSAPRV